MRNGLADVLHIRRQIPFPETADELCAVVSDIDADLDVHLGAHAMGRDRESRPCTAAGWYPGPRSTGTGYVTMQAPVAWAKYIVISKFLADMRFITDY